MREEVCPKRHGDGHLIYVGGPGYNSTSFGNYLPSEAYVSCSFCGGTGIVEVEEDEETENTVIECHTA